MNVIVHGMRVEALQGMSVVLFFKTRARGGWFLHPVFRPGGPTTIFTRGGYFRAPTPPKLLPLSRHPSANTTTPQLRNKRSTPRGLVKGK